MKIYIATPVNARSEATLEKKRQAAFKRVKYIVEQLRKIYPDAEYHSSFDDDIAPMDIDLTKRMYGCDMPSEPVIMGRCVQRVMECDMVVLDYDWQQSKGCKMENRAAQIYGIPCTSVWLLGIEME